MAYYNTIIKELDASRRLGAELAVERHQQELQRSKIQQELQILRRSRNNYIECQIAQSKKEYEQKLLEDPDVSEEHKHRQKRAVAEKAKIAQLDFERERERLNQERNEFDRIDKQYRLVDKSLLNLQARSRAAQDEEQRKIYQLNTRKTTLLKLIEDSKQRQLYHYEQSKKLSAF